MNHSDLYKAYGVAHFRHTAVIRIGSYDSMARFFRANYRKHLPSNRSSCIADLGCGAGHFLYYLDGEGYENVHGVDLSEEMVQICHHAGLTKAIHGDVLPFLAHKQQQFDAIVCNDLIEHIPREHMIEFVTAARKALSGGVFLVKTINAGSLFGAREVFVDFTHELGFTPESLAQVLRMGGFSSVEILPLRPAPQRVAGRVVKGINIGLIEPVIKGFIKLTEGPGTRNPMVVSQSMLAVARV